MEIDFVWKIGERSKIGKNHEELRYSIRSVVKHFKDLGKICIVGTKPDWVDESKILFIPTDDPHKKNKDFNINRKLEIAANTSEITENFVNISDDQLIIYNLGVNLLKEYTIDSDLRRMKGKNISTYGKRVLNTIYALKKQGIQNPHCYECHCPMLINKQKYKEILVRYDKGLCGNTLYFNSILDNGEQSVENVRAFIKRSYTMGQIIDECRGKLFLGYQKRALNENLKNFMKQRFSEKSIYEK